VDILIDICLDDEISLFPLLFDAFQPLYDVDELVLGKEIELTKGFGEGDRSSNIGLV
jgi:hypothetical protein